MLSHEKMKLAGQLVKDTFAMLADQIKEGMTTAKLDRLVHNFIVNNGGVPAPLGYTIDNSTPPYPKSICVSKNNILAHGIPSDSEQLFEGDLVSIDVSLSLDGHYSDACKLFSIGDLEDEVLAFSTDAVFAYELILGYVERTIAKGLSPADIGNYTEYVCNLLNLYTANTFGGHGIGQQLHLPPFIPPLEKLGSTVPIPLGSYFTIEPIFMNAEAPYFTATDGWTIVAPKDVLSVQLENTYYFGPQGLETLT